MDFLDIFGAQATVYLLEHPEVARSVSWATTIYQYVALGASEIDFSVGKVDFLPDGTLEALDNLRERLEYFDSPEDPEPPKETSVEIGGAQVEAEIAEIIEMQERHEKERADQAAQVQQFEEKLEKNYEGSPDKEEMMKNFEKAADEAAKALVAQQNLQLQQLQERQLQDHQHER